MDNLASPPIDTVAPVSRTCTAGDRDPDDFPLARRGSFTPANDRIDAPWPDRPIDIDESDPLSVLTFEFRQALLHPGSGNASQTGMALSDDTPSDSFSGPAFAAPVDHSAAGSSVLGLLTAGKSIDTLLGCLASTETTETPPIFEMAQRHDILVLLAPPGIRADRVVTVAPLTREEHHMFSVDSRIALSGSVEDLTLAPQDELHR